MGIAVDRSGLRYGRLVVTELLDKRGANRCLWWRCRCDCGRSHDVRGTHLSSGRVVSCGCLKNEKCVARSYRHGHAARQSRSATIRSWYGMKDRCGIGTTPKRVKYSRVSVCERWSASFDAFLEDMGERPAGMSIDRIDNDGHYSCGKCADCRSRGWGSNCRWATSSTQSRNRRSTSWITIKGERASLADWCDRSGLGQRLVRDRLRLGWSPRAAIEMPKLTPAVHRAG